MHLARRGQRLVRPDLAADEQAHERRDLGLDPWLRVDSRRALDQRGRLDACPLRPRTRSLNGELIFSATEQR
jgi:hypothetical protein